MKKKVFTILLLIFKITVFGQYSSLSVPISETFSQNKKYSIKSFSYNDEYPNLIGESTVYKNGKEIYKINRSFDLYDQYFLAISNNGKIVAYFTNVVFKDGNEFKNVTIYKDGKLFKSYNIEEFTGAKTNKEICQLFYNNYDEKIIDKKKSNWGTKEYKKVFKDSTPTEVIFLSDNFILNHNDTIYLTDSRKIVTIFDLKNAVIIAHENFDLVYPKIKNLKKQNSYIKYYHFPLKYIHDFEDSASGIKLSNAISNLLNVKPIPVDSFYKNRQYKLYRIELSGYLNHRGKFEIDNIKCDSSLNEKKITNYISQTTFKVDFLPIEADKFYFKRFFCNYRNWNDSVSLIEKKHEIENKKTGSLRMEILDSINGFYIPKNMEDAILELDKKLNFESKKQILEASIKGEHSMFNGHIGFGLPLGAWIRNNWGFHNSSRLKKYFYDRGIIHSEGMSWAIIDQYVKWLSKKSNWQEWEKNNPATNKTGNINLY